MNTPGVRRELLRDDTAMDSKTSRCWPSHALRGYRTQDMDIMWERQRWETLSKRDSGGSSETWCKRFPRARSFSTNQRHPSVGSAAVHTNTHTLTWQHWRQSWCPMKATSRQCTGRTMRIKKKEIRPDEEVATASRTMRHYFVLSNRDDALLCCRRFSFYTHFKSLFSLCVCVYFQSVELSF